MTPRASIIGDGLRLAIGTLTRIPVPPPRTVDRRVAGLAMSLAPLVGLLLWAIVAIVLGPLAGATRPEGDSLRSLVIASVAVAALAWLTRALHLDGLADTSDALGSGQPPGRALDIARQPDIGPFGVVSLVLTLLLQTAALATALSHGSGVANLGVALVVSRIALVWACTSLLPAARADGLGATVAGAVPIWVAASWLAAALAIGVAWTMAGPSPLGGPATGIAAVIGAAVAGSITLALARRRLGGITGDVLGATIEITMAACLVAAALTTA